MQANRWQVASYRSDEANKMTSASPAATLRKQLA